MQIIKINYFYFFKNVVVMTKIFATVVFLFASLPLISQAPNAAWEPDWDGDGNVGVADLLGLLGVFGDNDVDGDGIWDSVDDCIGQFDECGVCNGDGPQYWVIDTIISFTDSVYIDELELWYTYENSDTSYVLACSEWTCGDPLLHFNHNYGTVEIAGQCWFSENLRTENYTNGENIPSNLNTAEWSETTIGARSVYGESDYACSHGEGVGFDPCNETDALENFGRLYNAYSVIDSRGLCPSGWHVPSDSDWMDLEIGLGMTEAQAQGTGGRGTIQGTILKSTYGWHGGGGGTDNYGFTIRSSGGRFWFGGFDGAGPNGYYWSTSETAEGNVWIRRFMWDSSQIVRSSYPKPTGFAVRCVID